MLSGHVYAHFKCVKDTLKMCFLNLLKHNFSVYRDADLLGIGVRYGSLVADLIRALEAWLVLAGLSSGFYGLYGTSRAHNLKNFFDAN